MRDDIKAIWVEALRSGEYKQGHGRLKTVDEGEPRYCCLGVLNEISDEVEPLETNSTPTSLSTQSLNAIGLRLDAQTILIDINDGRFRPHLSFSDIADFIEENL